jgi:phage tail tape-measure protein
MQNYELMNRSFLGNAQAQISSGDLQRDLEQQRLDAARNLPLERLGILQSAFSGSQLPYGSSTSSPTQRRNLVGSVGGGALSGAAAGASIGAAGGPITAGTGALIGGALGLFS